MILDYFIFSINNLRHRSLRSSLTLLGIFIGIAAVVALISLGQGLQDAIQTQFERIGSNRITISPGGAIGGPGSEGITKAKLYEDDVEVVKKVRNVNFATGALVKTTSVEFEDHQELIMVMGFDTDAKTTNYIEKLDFLELEEGRNPKPRSKYEAVLGYRVANDFFDDKIKVGDKIYIEGQEFRVVGIQKVAGTYIHDLIIRIPKESAREIFNRPDEVSNIFVETKENVDPEVVAEAIKKDLRKHRNVEKGKEDFSVETVGQVIEIFTRVFSIVTTLLVGIAAISLLVGGVGITNTMYTAVLERTKEIGIMKAVGAKNSDIMLIFLIESGLLGLLGGIIGVILGITLSKSVEFIGAQYIGTDLLVASTPPTLIIGALLFAFLVGSISGTLPAIQASKLKPAEALRYE